MSAKLWALLVILSVLWGGSFFLAEIALEDFSPYMTVTLRVGIAALVLLLYLLIIRKWQSLGVKMWLILLVMGALNNAIPFTLITWGQVYIESGLAAILNATTPLFTVLLAHVMTQDEKMSVNKLIGVITGFIGVVCLIGPVALSGQRDVALGQAAVLVAAISYAFAGIWGKRLRRLPAAQSAAGMLLGSTVLMLVFCVAKGEVFTFQASIPGWASIISLAVLSSALAYLIYFYILAEAGTTNLLLVTFLIPLSALILGVVFLNETFTINAIIGMILIIFSLVCIDGRRFRKSN